MQQIQEQMNHYLPGKVLRFIKRSFLFAFLSATLLYVLVRIFFYEFPFTAGEGFELHIKILLVIWIFIISCKLLFTGIVLIENFNKVSTGKILYVPVLKKAILVALAAIFGYVGKTQVTDDNKFNDTVKTPCEEPANDTSIFLVKLPY